MIPYAVYKTIHYLGIFLLLVVLSTGLGRAAAFQATTVPDPPEDPWRRRLLAGHGVALFLVLLGGFGMLARLDITEGLRLPGWIWTKLGIWGTLAAAVVLSRRGRLAAAGLVVVPVLALLAGWVALYKPL